MKNIPGFVVITISFSFTKPTPTLSAVTAIYAIEFIELPVCRHAFGTMLNVNVIFVFEACWRLNQCRRCHHNVLRKRQTAHILRMH
jgi:hypothetical protein